MKKFHGVLSLGLILAAVGVGVYAIARSSVILAAFYIGLTVIGILLVVYSFCSKCACRSHACSHIIPGKITGLFPTRAQAGYTGLDISLTMLALLVILFFPQYWLLQSVLLLGLFWVLMVSAVAEILLTVCPGCNNKICPLCKNKV